MVEKHLTNQIELCIHSQLINELITDSVIIIKIDPVWSPLAGEPQVTGVLGVYTDTRVLSNYLLYVLTSKYGKVLKFDIKMPLYTVRTIV